MAPAVMEETEINIRARSPEAIANVVQELDRIKAVKEDFLVPAHNIQFSVVDDSVVADVKLSDGAWVPPVRYELSRTAHTGIAAKFDVSARYARRMRAEAPDLLATNLNYWASRDNRRFLVRTLDGKVRAFLSDRYRIVDTSLLFYNGYEKIKAMEGSIIGLDLTEDSFYMRMTIGGWEEKIDRAKVLTRELSRSPDHGNLFDGADDKGGIKYSPVDAHIKTLDGQHENMALREVGYRDDTLVPFLVIRNSETGLGSVGVEGGCMRPYCLNCAIVGEQFLKAHLGPRHDYNGILSNATVNAENEALFGSVRDIITATLDRDKFKTLVQQFGTADSLKLANPTAAVERVVDEYDLSPDIKQSIYNELISEGDDTVFGLVQAVTATARDFTSPDAAIALERIGGQLLERAPQLVEIRR